jgi:hypothetical protein
MVFICFKNIGCVHVAALSDCGIIIIDVMLALGQQFLHFLHICMLLGSRVTLPIESDCLRIRFFTIADVIFHVACLLGLTLIFMLVLFFKRVNFWFNLGVFYW